MKASFLIMLALSLVLGGIAYSRNPRLLVDATRSGGLLLLQLMPILVLAFFVAGLIEVLVPTQMVMGWVGKGSGPRGLLVSTLLGAVAPGGPFIQFPLLAALYKAGMGIGPLVAYLSAWSLIGLNRVIAFEIPLLGLRVAATRLACSLIFPVVIGYIAQLVFERLPQPMPTP